MRNCLMLALLLGLGACRTPTEFDTPVEPQAPPRATATSEVPSEPAWVYDPENAQEILDTCAGCHGKDGEGGSDGVYPRLAGLKAKYIAKQLRAFKAKERVNIPMYPYAIERDLPEPDVLDISRLLSKIKLPTEMPEFDDSMSAFQKLRAAGRVFNVANVEGDVAKGAEIYEEKCRRCHGRAAKGRGASPQLAGQYTQYIERQIHLYRTRKRTVEEEEMQKAIDSLSKRDIQDLLAYFSSRDD